MDTGKLRVFGLVSLNADLIDDNQRNLNTFIGRRLQFTLNLEQQWLDCGCEYLNRVVKSRDLHTLRFFQVCRHPKTKKSIHRQSKRNEQFVIKRQFKSKTISLPFHLVATCASG